MTKTTRTLLLLTLLGLAGCAGPQSPEQARFDEHGLAHVSYPYRIVYADGRPGTFISDEWVVESHRVGPGGRPGEHLDSEPYVHMRRLDLDDDGDRDRVQRVFTYDLRLRHRTTNGMIWVRTMPLTPAIQSRELRVLAQNYASSVAGGRHYMVATVAPEQVDVRERRFATEILDSMRMRFHDHEAYGFILDVADVDQLRLSERSRFGRAAIVLVRTSFGWRQYSAYGERQWPVLMVIGYVNGPDDFDEGLHDFETFLASFRMPDVEAAGER